MSLAPRALLVLWQPLITRALGPCFVDFTEVFYTVN